MGGLNHNIFGWIVWRDGQTVLDLAGTGTTIFSGGLFRGVKQIGVFLGDWHHNIFGWIVWRWVVMDRLFWIWQELALQYFWADCFEETHILGGMNHNIFGWIGWCDGQTILDLAGTGTTIFSGGLFRGVNS